MAKMKTKTAVIRESVTPDSLREAFADFPAIDLLSRRFIDPRDPGSLPILLKDEDPDACINSEHQNLVQPNQTSCKKCGHPVRKWFVYWANTAKEGRYSQMTAKAYVPVEVRELRDEMDVADLVKQVDGSRTIVRRGDRGQEILMKQPLAAWLYIKRKKREDAQARAASARARREQRADALGKQFGDEAGQTTYDGGGIREEVFRRERTTLGEEAGVADE